MNIIKNKENDTLFIALAGRLDTTTAPELEASFNESKEGVKNVILDFEKLEYISSAGLRVLLSMQKAVMGKGRVVVKNANDSIKEVFDMTGFADIVVIE